MGRGHIGEMRTRSHGKKEVVGGGGAALIAVVVWGTVGLSGLRGAEDL